MTDERHDIFGYRTRHTSLDRAVDEIMENMDPELHDTFNELVEACTRDPHKFAAYVIYNMKNMHTTMSNFADAIETLQTHQGEHCKAIKEVEDTLGITPDITRH